MTDPDRLSRRKTGLGGTLLRSARDDAPSGRARRRAALALGLAGGSTAATTGTAAASSAVSAASKAGALGAVAFAKWMGVGAMTGVIALGSVQATTGAVWPIATAPSQSFPAPRPVDPRPRANLAGIRAPASSSNVPPAIPAIPTSAPAPSADPSPPSAIAPPAPVAPPSKRPVLALDTATAPFTRVAAARPHEEPADSAPSSLADELHLLERARTALAAGDARGALDALDAHELRFARGTLAPEAAVLRIEALAAHGDDAEATARADAFLAGDPEGVQARRVRSIRSAIEAKKKP
ncbi:MAG: hypothetical protein FWD17_03845 [Polyangiaceae bacterium]|nr:hypothetical protein [Polyangiaceae bacterium]